MLQAVLQQGLGDNLAKFEEVWKTWEHQVDVYEKLATSNLVVLPRGTNQTPR